MARFMLVAAAGLGFLLTIALANLLVPVLHGVSKRSRPASQKTEAKGISWGASNKGIPTMGGLCVMLASLISITSVCIGISTVQPELVDVQWTNQVQLAVVTAFGFAVIGLLNDLVRVWRNQPAGLSEWLKCLLQMLGVGLVIIMYGNYGYLNTATRLPAVGYYDFGMAYYPFAFFLLLFFVRSVEKSDGVDGLCTSCAFIALLGLVVLSVGLGCFEAAVFPAALAGSLLAFLFWNFHPAKISLGSTGSLFLAGAMVGIVQGFNWPGLLLLLGLPYFAEGMFSLVQFVRNLFTRKPLAANMPLHAFLQQHGWGAFGMIYLFSGISAMGVIFAFLFVRLG